MADHDEAAGTSEQASERHPVGSLEIVERRAEYAFTTVGVGENAPQTGEMLQGAAHAMRSQSVAIPARNVGDHGRIGGNGAI